MRKRKDPAFSTEALGNMTPEAVEVHNREMREKANPLVRGMMDEVQAAIDDENRLMDAQFEAHAKLRAWAKDLLGYEISITQIEELQAEIKAAKAGQIITCGRTAIIKTPFGTVDRAERYLNVLEKAIIDLSNKSQPKQFSISTESAKDPYTELSSFGLIKLAVKRLFKRSK